MNATDILMSEHRVIERVEHEETGEGVHEKYLALAEKPEKEMGLS